MIVGPRVEFDPDDYPRIRVWDSCAQKDRYLCLHRLVAYVHEKIDDIWAAEEVHHLDHERWNSRPENLDARDFDRPQSEIPRVPLLSFDC